MKALLALASGLLVASASASASASPSGAAPAPERYQWSRSLAVDFLSPGIGALGGTEARSLVAFDGKLFAGIGYWRDTQAADPALPGAQVIALDAPNAPWRVDLQLDDVVPSGPQAGLKRFQAIGSLAAFEAHRDASGHALARPVPFLFASVWDRVGGLRLFVRGAGAKATWSFVDLATDVPRASQIRSFGTHVDAVTKRELFFAGTSPGGVYAGTYDGGATFVHWDAKPEVWDDDQPGVQRRIMAFAECNGKLYASSGFELFERQDGTAPSWKRIYAYENPSPNPHISGFRGLHAIPAAAGGEQLLIAVENNPLVIVRVDPRQVAAGKRATVDLDVSAFLSRAWNTRVTYGIAAYNDMVPVRLPGASCDSLLLGIEATTPSDPSGAGKNRKHAAAQYLVRRCDGHYELASIDDPGHPDLPLVSTRTIARSPFSADPAGTLYAGGLDAGNLIVHNTAWIYRGVRARPSR